MVNKAKSCAVRERKAVPTVMFDERVFPERWPAMPEDELLSKELRRRMRQAPVSLPERQRDVLELRDVYGYSADETCWMLEISAVNQRAGAISPYSGRGR